MLVSVAIFCMIGCTFDSVPAGTRITRYGVSFQLPPVESLTLLNGRKRWVRGYFTPFDICYNWQRPKKWMATFCVDFEPNNFSAPQSSIDIETVKAYLAAWHAQDFFELTELIADADDRYHKGSYRFRLIRRYTNRGNAGQAIRLDGYLLVHPSDPEHLVILYALRVFELAEGPADAEADESDAAWFSSVTFSEPTPAERRLMRLPLGEWKWVLP